MATPRLVFVHGWGFDPSFWRPVLDALHGFETALVDLGFFGTPSIPPLEPGRPTLAVGHSLGVLWLLRAAPFVWDRLVAFDGFPRFVAGADFPGGVPVRVLDRMRARCVAEPEATLADFRRRCGAPPAARPADAARLREGLDWLAFWDGRPSLASKRPVWIAASRADPIAPPTLTEAWAATAGVRPAWREEPGHGLPTTAPGFCADLIRQAAVAP